LVGGTRLSLACEAQRTAAETPAKRVAMGLIGITDPLLRKVAQPGEIRLAVEPLDDLNVGK
jgi:hypothetical protein